jgi:hypothetical protein
MQRDGRRASTRARRNETWTLARRKKVPPPVGTMFSPSSSDDLDEGWPGLGHCVTFREKLERMMMLA